MFQYLDKRWGIESNEGNGIQSGKTPDTDKTESPLQPEEDNENTDGVDKAETGQCDRGDDQVETQHDSTGNNEQTQHNQRHAVGAVQESEHPGKSDSEIPETPEVNRTGAVGFTQKSSLRKRPRCSIELSPTHKQRRGSDRVPVARRLLQGADGGPISPVQKSGNSIQVIQEVEGAARGSINGNDQPSQMEKTSAELSQPSGGPVTKLPHQDKSNKKGLLKKTRDLDQYSQSQEG